MTCNNIEILLATRRDLPPEEERAVQTHVRSCARCAVAWEREQRTSQLLQSLPVVQTHPSPQVTQGVRARLTHSPRRRTPHVAAALVVALCCLILVSVVAAQAYPQQAQQVAARFGLMANASTSASAQKTSSALPSVSATSVAPGAASDDVLAQPPVSCPVTRPSQPAFTPPAPYPSEAPYEHKFWYGSAALWTMLPTDGTWAQLADGEKVFWWREGYNGQAEPEPALTVTGKRLDAPAPAVQIGPLATNAYHEDFHWAMLIGVDLPSAGCWELTGSYQNETLSFVVWVAP